MENCTISYPNPSAFKMQARSFNDEETGEIVYLIGKGQISDMVFGSIPMNTLINVFVDNSNLRQCLYEGFEGGDYWLIG